MKPEDKLKKARMRLAMGELLPGDADPERKAVAAAAYSLLLAPGSVIGIEDSVRTVSNGKPTMATNGRDVFIHPEFLDGCSTDHIVSGLCHEALHKMLQHIPRFADKLPEATEQERRRSNIAMDMTVNRILVDLGLELPFQGVEPEPADDKHPWEWWYDQLEPDDEEDSGWGDNLLDAPEGMTADELRAKTELDIKNAQKAARCIGKMPQGLELLLGEVLRPKVPWKELLQRFVRKMMVGGATWKRPNRRWINRGVALPDHKEPAIPDILVAVDTSGSMSADMPQVVGEVFDIVRMACNKQPELTILWVDTEVTPQVVSDVSELKPTGGGGTEFSRVFEWVTANERRPEGMVFLTDGHVWGFGDVVPTYPVLWVLSAPNPHFKPPFGSVGYTID